MKSSTVKLMVATAACLVASCAASAAELRFEIPFAFEAAGKAMAAGTYKVQPSIDEKTFALLDARTGNGIFVLSQADLDPQKQWTSSRAAVLEFMCRESRCALSQLYTNDGHPAHKIAIPKQSEGRSGRVALIRAVTGN